MTPDVQPGTGWPAKFPGMPRQPTFTPPAFSVWNMTKKMGTDRRGRMPSLSALRVFGVIARAEQVHNDCPRPLFRRARQQIILVD